MALQLTDLLSFSMFVLTLLIVIGGVAKYFYGVVQRLRSEVLGRLDRLEGKIDPIGQSVTRLEEHVNTQNGRVEKAENRLQHHEDQMVDFWRTPPWKEFCDGLDQRIDTLSREMQQIISSQ